MLGRNIGALASLAAGILLAAQPVAAAEIQVVASGGFTAAYKDLAPRFEKLRGDTLLTQAGASMGDTPTAIPNRLQRGEAIDVVIMAREALDLLVAKGQIVKGSEVDLVRSKIAMAVKAGAPVPEISTVDALKATLQKAKSVAYSDSASGVYLSKELFPKLGLAAAMAGKGKMIAAPTMVGEVIATGDYEVGFQQLSELKPVQGIRIVGLIPAAVQKVTVYSAGVVATSKEPAEARELIRFLASPAAYSAIRSSGLEPAASATGK